MGIQLFAAHEQRRLPNHLIQAGTMSGFSFSLLSSMKVKSEIESLSVISDSFQAPAGMTLLQALSHMSSKQLLKLKNFLSLLIKLYHNPLSQLTSL